MTPSTTGPDRSGRPARVPAPVTVAASVVALEAALLVLLGLALVPAADGDRLAVGATSVAFFLLYGGFLGYCAWQFHRLHSWARAPMVLAQLIQILVGVSLWSQLTILAIVAMLLGVLALVGIFHPASLAALESDDGSARGG